LKKDFIVTSELMKSSKIDDIPINL